MNNWPRLAVSASCKEVAKHPEEYLRELRRAGAELVWLAFPRCFDPETLQGALSTLPDALAAVEGAGLQAGVWAQAFGFGAPVPEKERPFAPFQPRVDIHGRAAGDAFCPTDPRFTAFLGDLVQRFVKAGARLIMLDDDLCLNVLPGVGCTCPRHLAAFEKRLGRPVAREEIKTLVYTGAPSREREVWLQAAGDSMRDFCRAMRQAVDQVDPAVRLGFCAGFTSWDLEGADALELTRLLAGNTRPFLRLTGAPYWAQNHRFQGQTMAHIVEFTRLQEAWCRGQEVDVFTENDSFPRPAYRVPASRLETFDFCMAVSGERRQLKYLLDYYSRPGHETAYVDAHLRNRALIADCAAALAGLEDGGVYVHEEQFKFGKTLCPPAYAGDPFILNTAFPRAAELLSGLGIPVCYQPQGEAAAAFGCAGATVPLDQKGYILDFPAAMEMEKRGVDAGLLGGEEAFLPEFEWYEKHQDRVMLREYDYDREMVPFYRARLKPGVQVESWYVRGTERIPGSYFYQNAQGVCFLVLLFRGDGARYDGSLAQSYYRQEQLLSGLERMGAPLPAVIRRKAKGWLMCRRGPNTLGVAVCNFSLDEMVGAAVQLQEEWKTARFLGVKGQLSGKEVALEPVPAQRFGVILLEK